MAERRMSGAAGMMSGNNPAQPPQPSGYERVNGILQRIKGYKGAEPVTREKYVNTTPTGFKSPYIPEGRTKISPTGGASAMMSGNDPTAPIYTPQIQQEPSSFLKVENPTQNPERPSQATGGKMYGALPPTVNQNLGAYDSSVTLPGMTRELPVDYKETEQQAGAKAETHRAGAGFGREQRVSQTGVVQTGTSTSPKPMTMDDANKLLTGGYKMNENYASNQLPYTQTSPYAGKGNAEIYNPETLHQHDSDVDYVKLSKDIYGDQSGVESYTRGGEMNKDYEQMDVDLGQSTAGKPEKSIPKRPSGARQAEKWDRKYGGADFSAESEAPATSGFDMERRAAFLGGAKEGVGSMQALRRSEAVQGISYAGGKHYIADGKGGKNLVEVGDKKDARIYKSGEEGARQIRDKYVNALTSKGDYSEYQSDAPAPLPDAVPGNSNIDKSQLDTSDLMDMNPSESIIGNNTPSRTVKKGTLFNR